MCWFNGTPGPGTCGVPVRMRSFRTWLGVSGAPSFAFARPCTQAAAPVTIGDALDVPEKRSVYQAFSFGPPCASPYPHVVTCHPHPWTLTILP